MESSGVLHALPSCTGNVSYISLRTGEPPTGNIHSTSMACFLTIDYLPESYSFFTALKFILTKISEPVKQVVYLEKIMRL